MNTTSRPRLVGLLAILTMVGIADLLVLNLYAFPRYVASVDAQGAAPTTDEAGNAAPTVSAQEVEAQRQGETVTTPEGQAAGEEVAAAAAPQRRQKDPVRERTTPEMRSVSRASTTGTGGRLAGIEDHIFPNVHFLSGSAELRPGACKLLREAARALLEHPNRRMLIEGHADRRGARSLNMSLSASRARAVVQFLEAEGVAQRQLDIVALGSRAPVAPGTSNSACSRNRRVALIWR